MKLVKWNAYFGRMGELSGLFALNEDEYNYLQESEGKEVYFGEALGKHSEIIYTMDLKDFTVIPLDEAAVSTLIQAFGSPHFSGENPLGYLEDQEDEEE